MSKSRFALLFLLCGLIVLPALSPAPVVVRPGESPTYVPPNQPTAPNAASAQAQFDNALAFEQAGQNAQAIDGYRKVVRRFPRSPLASNAQYKVGLLLEKTGDLEGAFKAYVKLNKEYPRSEDFNASRANRIASGLTMTTYLAREPVAGKDYYYYVTATITPAACVPHTGTIFVYPLDLGQRRRCLERGLY
jgi:tetratricopeptide (TPR) repeat protein